MENSAKEQTNNLSLKGEFYRKTIHFFSSAIPIGYYFIPKNIVLSIIIPLLFLMLLVEAVKYKNDFIYGLYLRYFKSMLRDHEADRRKIRINGASWLLAADVLCIIIFPKYIAITGCYCFLFPIAFPEFSAGFMEKNSMLQTGHMWEPLLFFWLVF